ncbi:MAG: hypothetical protein IPN29_06140 [Saprospiraceae bacterium]|nr:hypothetical protein [Saprospiraceae bacterium]
MIGRKLRTFFNPERFQGWGVKKGYFEGWYFKMVTSDARHAFAVIPGIAIDETGNGHAFIQVLDGKKKTSSYHTFKTASFRASSHAFEVWVGDCYFHEKGMTLNNIELEGELVFQGNVPWPKPWYSPGIMGPFAFVPFMECYHGIVSMDHTITGAFHYDKQNIALDGGKGYLEKDWGRSFPSAYVWMQSNHFDNPKMSFKLSVARIPWVRNAFTGFIAGLYTGNELIAFTTYNQSSLVQCNITNDFVQVELMHPKYLLKVMVKRDEATALAAPINGFMHGRIEESMTATLWVQLIDRKTKMVIMDDIGHNGGLEVAGNIAEIQTN